MLSWRDWVWHSGWKKYGEITGFKHKSFITDYYSLLPRLQHNRRYLFEFAQLLREQKRYNDSNDMLRRGELISNDPMFVVLQGNNYRDMGMIEMAEEKYIQAWCTMPNRIYPLYRLMKLHEQQNKPKALMYAKQIGLFKEKITSPAVRQIKREAYELINTR